jgi:hypothetical protein
MRKLREAEDDVGLGGRTADRCGGDIVEEGLLAGGEHRQNSEQDDRPCGM